MQFKLKSALLCLLGASVGLSLSKYAAANEVTAHLLVIAAVLVGAVGFWGLALGAMFGIPWRAFLVSSLAAAAAIFGYIFQKVDS